MEESKVEDWNRVWIDQYADINRAKNLSRWKKFAFDSLPRSTSILDVGAGCGEFLAMLREKGFTDLRGVEPEKALIERGPADLMEQGSCLDLGRFEARFDVALMFGVLHHLRDFGEMKRAAENIRGALKEGGRLYSVEPWKHPIRSIVTKVVLETPLAKIHPFFRIESQIWKIEKPLLNQWLDLEKTFVEHMRHIGFRVALDRKDLRAHYIIYQRT